MSNPPSYVSLHMSNLPSYLPAYVEPPSFCFLYTRVRATIATIKIIAMIAMIVDNAKKKLSTPIVVAELSD